MRSLDAQKTQIVVTVSPGQLAGERDRLTSACSIRLTISSMSSVTCTRSMSVGAIVPAVTNVSRSQSIRPFQYDELYRTTGNDVTLRVCTKVSDSNNSSKVPYPPGKTTN